MAEEGLRQLVTELEQTAEQLEAKHQVQQAQAREPWAARMTALVNEVAVLNSGIEARQRKLEELDRAIEKVEADPEWFVFWRLVPWGLAGGSVLWLAISHQPIAGFLAAWLFAACSFAARTLGTGR